MGFLISFELFDDVVGIFGVVFRNPSLNTGSVKQEHGSFFLINLLTNGFGQVNKPVKHGL